MIFGKINAFLNTGGKRTSLVKKNILATFFIKGFSVLISLLYVPVTLNYLNATRYGIWMTLTSIIAWMSVFDIGLGNGLRNKLAEALALGDKEKAKKYVSTAYAMLSIIVVSVLLLFYIANHWINWSLLLNTSESYGEELKKVALIVVTLFGLKFILNIVSTVFTADQRPAFGSIFELIGNTIGLLIIFILTLTGKTSLISFGLASMLTPVIVYSGASFFFYKRKYSYLKPAWRSIDLSYAKDLIGLGIQFFAIQIAVLVIFQTSNILIARFFSPAEVTPYNIIYKYFSIVTMFWGILMAPFWSAFTNAWVIKDIKWIKKAFSKILLGYSFLIIITIVLYLLRGILLPLWLGKSYILINKSLAVSVIIYVLITSWNNIFAFFLNGVGKIRLSLCLSILSAFFIIPFNYIFIKVFHFGVSGVIISINLSLLIGIFLGPIQTYLIINNKAKGIWNR